MANVRVMPPPTGNTSTTVNGRPYGCAAGATLDVPDFDAAVLVANGWTAVADGVGSTSARPASPYKGQKYHDNTLGLTIVWDGRVWRSPVTGAAV